MATCPASRRRREGANTDEGVLVSCWLERVGLSALALI
jgi:hypothetical protein